MLVLGRDGPLTGVGGDQVAARTSPRARSTLGSILTGPIICGCSSASTSFMLASLRAGHVDSFHPPAGIAQIEECPSVTLTG